MNLQLRNNCKKITRKWEKYEDNNVFINAKDLFDFLLDHWQFQWLYTKGKENGVAEYEDYERSLAKEQREE